MNLTGSREDYLEAIYEVCEEEKVARVKDVAGQMGVSLASVNYAMKVLKEMGLINHRKYGYIELTKKGQEVGSAILKKHKLIKKFLIDVLNVDKGIANKDACSIEHVISEETYNKMDSFLKSR